MSEINMFQEKRPPETKMAEDSEGELFSSNFFRPLIDLISSPEVSEFFHRLKLDEEGLNDLKSNLQSLDAVVDYADSAASENKQVKAWLDELNDVKSDLEDLLDEIVTELRPQDNTKTRFRGIFSAKLSSHETDIKQRQKLITAKIEDLQGQEKILGLKKASRKMRESSVGRECFVDNQSQVFSRDEDKETIVKLLLLDDDHQTDVITIMGEGGVGKTTLAQLVYNDERVKKHFDFKCWIQVSEDFHDLLLTEAVFHAVTYQRLDIGDQRFQRLLQTWVDRSDVKDVDFQHLLQTNVKESLKQKKFLLVLDNLSQLSDCGELRRPLAAWAKGSKIIVTTSHPELQETIGNLSTFTVRSLTNEESRMIFAKHAFPDKKSSLHPQLEAIVEEIVKMCHGLPLAAKILGSVLHFKPLEEWHAVLNNNILNWDKDPKTSVFKVSYNDLPICLKRCIAYCSIFPTYHEYEKEKLILLWMAEGFLQQMKGMTMEEVGYEYFRNLTYRSFFQPSGAKKSCFIMHDLLKDLAHSESGCIYSRVGYDEYFQVSSKTRHLLISGGKNIAERCKAICAARFLRTLIFYKSSWENESCQLSGELLNNLFNALPRLRVLSLSHYDLTVLPHSINKLKFLRFLDFSYTTITQLPDSVSSLYNLQTLLLSRCYHFTKLPDSIHKLLYLRFLNLSYTGITKLPDSVSSLYNLQTLLLSSCHSVTTLPEKMRNLTNLCHLDIRGTYLKEMPADIGRLTNLQDLSDFVVGKDSGLNIKELRALSNLRGTLHLSQLQNVVSAGDASEANLNNKPDLQVLKLEWSSIKEDPQHDTDVLEKLEPHKNLEELSIISYSGTRFPGWLGNSSFSKMVYLRLSNCNRCSHLPPLGQLPSLKGLDIKQMNAVKMVGPELFRMNCSLVKPFPSLEILVFEQMLNWEEWISPEVQGEEFPRLKLIRFLRCLKLACLPLCFPRSAEVEISECPLLTGLDTDDWQLYDGKEMQFNKVAAGPLKPPVFESLQFFDSFYAQLKNEDEIDSQSLGCRTDVPSTSHCSPPELPKLSTEVAVPKVPATVEKQFHENKMLLARPSTSILPEVEELQLPDSNVMQKTDVSITSNSPTWESPKRLTEDSSAEQGGTSDDSATATENSSNADTDDPVDLWYAEDSLEDISSPEQGSLNVSQILQLKKLPPKLNSLKIEGCDALKSLPEELMHNTHLRHLYIIDCYFFKSIHLNHLPVALKTLYIRKCRKLEFPSPLETMGEHTSLEHLCIESSCDSLKSFPLGYFPKLRNLSIQDCVNFNSISIGSEDHMSLDGLDIRDCAQLIIFNEEGLPVPNLTSLLLSNCKDLKALPGDLHNLTSLRSLVINECPELKSIPQGGLPTSLNLVCISSCHQLTPCIEWGLHRLKNFSRIEIEDGCRDLKSFPKQNLLPRNLNSLQISRFPNLKFLDYKGLQHLTSLETLKIISCNNLQSFPEEGLPSSLSYLYISDCPLLKSKLENRRGKEWYKIAHISHIEIDMEVISSVRWCLVLAT